ncbi:MAG: hypothetical protein ABII12_09055 [Planctomycetota bacterium]
MKELLMPKTRLALMLPLVLVLQSGCFDGGTLIQLGLSSTLGIIETTTLDAIGPITVVAVAESSNAANPGQSILLNGSNSFVQLGSGSTISATEAGLTYAWEITEVLDADGEVELLGDGVLQNADSSQPTFTATTPGEYTITLTVADTAEREGVSFVTITVG